jgi:hypothetical protein
MPNSISRKSKSRKAAGQKTTARIASDGRRIKLSPTVTRDEGKAPVCIEGPARGQQTRQSDRAPHTGVGIAELSSATKSLPPTTRSGTTQRFGLGQPPQYIIDRLKQEKATLDFDALSARLVRIVAEIEPIKIPSQEMWEGLLVQASLGLPFDYPYYWALHFYKGSDEFRRRVEEFNTAVESSGLVQLARGEKPDFASPAAVIRRGIAKTRMSSAFIDAWFRLGMLYGELSALRALNEGMAHTFKGAVTETTIGQRVWYARCLVANTNLLEKERHDAEFDLAEICEDIVNDRRKLPSNWIWNEDWFRKLLPPEKKAQKDKAQVQVKEKGVEAGLLADRLTRLSNDEIRRLAGHTCITADLLPPLVLSEFPPRSRNHP